MRDLVVQTLARATETSPVVRSLVSRLDFPGRWRVLREIRADRLPNPLRTHRQGVQLTLDPRDYVQRSAYFRDYEPETVRAFRTLLRPGDWVVDVGANVGVFSLLAAGLVKDLGHVFAFEPSPSVMARLRASRDDNPHLTNRLTLIQSAVSDQRSDATLYAPKDSKDAGWGSLAHFADIPSVPIPVRAVTLDDWWQHAQRPRIRLLKMDIEGYEPEALAGATTLLASGAVEYLILEFNGPRLAERGVTWTEFMAPLLEAGYRLRRDVLTDAALDAISADPTVAATKLTNVCLSH